MNTLPERRNPAEEGPGSEMEHALGNAATAYRNCRRPAQGSTREAILDELLSGRTLTSLRAWREFGASRLAADIYALRGLGWPVVSEEIVVAAREGRTVRIARYRLPGGEP